MKIFKRITALFSVCAVMFSLSGCLNPALSRIPYRSKDDMIEQAIKNSNITWLKELLPDCTPEERARYAFKIIDNMVNHSRFYVADAICEMGVDFNDTDYPMLAMSAKRLDYEAIKYFLEKGADPNIRDSDGYSPLLYSMENRTGFGEASGYFCSQILVENGAEPYPEMFQNEYEGDPERNVGNGAYRQIAHSPMTAKFLLGVLLESGQESGLPKAVEYAVLGECEKSLNELKNGNTVSDVDMGLISYYFGYFGTMEQYQAFADFWGKYAKPPASCVAGAGNAEVLKRLYLDKDPDNEDSKEYILDFQDCDLLITALLAEQPEIVKLLLGYEAINLDWLSDSIGGAMDRVFDTSPECFRLMYDYCCENLPDGFKEKHINRFMPDRGKSLKNKYEIIDFLFDEGFDCRYIDLEWCTSDTINYLYKKGRPMMIDDLWKACSYGNGEAVTAAVEAGVDPNFAYSFDVRDTYNTAIEINGDQILYSYSCSSTNVGVNLKEFVPVEAYGLVTSGFMTYEELCGVVEPNSGLHMFCLYQSPETLQYVIDRGLVLPDDCLFKAEDYSAANVRVLLENGANTKAKIDVIPVGSMKFGAIKRGEFTVREYFEACDRHDLTELLEEYE